MQTLLKQIFYFCMPFVVCSLCSLAPSHAAHAHPHADAAPLTAANAACLTASSHLTSLQLQQDMLKWPSQAFSSMFTGCELPDLQDLTIGLNLLCNHSAMQHMVHSCPKLRRLYTKDAKPQGQQGYLQQDPDAVVLSVQPGVLRQSLGALAALTGLQELQLPLVDPALSKECWAALAACSGLERLDVVSDGRAPLEMMRGITKLRQLTHLELKLCFDDNTPLCICTYKDSSKSALQVRAVLLHTGLALRLNTRLSVAQG